MSFINDLWDYMEYDGQQDYARNSYPVMFLRFSEYMFMISIIVIILPFLIIYCSIRFNLPYEQK